ncbi:DUF2017 domain-containing protein [Streptacidiphilus monticola]|uniref:DUF2017 domain-containing protein n=1 Tax=Streptacidiphilus monticola TaxID=2161674 RepID=A0ABW1FYV0_9ACTN
MPGLFERTRDGAAALALDAVEASILRSLEVQMLELLGPGPEEQEDPLAALLADGPTRKPEDPALARLFPDAYDEGEEAADHSAEFRRYTENDLRARKRDDALAVIRSIDAASRDDDGDLGLRLDPDTARHWLGALNDLRLTLGTRLDVAEDDDSLYSLPDEDERKPLVMAYLWLGGLQETLIDVLAS